MNLKWTGPALLGRNFSSHWVHPTLQNLVLLAPQNLAEEEVLQTFIVEWRKLPERWIATQLRLLAVIMLFTRVCYNHSVTRYSSECN